MEENDPDLLVAVCHEARQRCSQCHADERREQLTIGKVFRSKSRSKTETFSFIWMSHLCAGQRATKRKGAPKWRQRSWLRVYLGPSPNHARSVALVLNPRTGHVSPQFHVKFDDFF